jgi:hypothetical protein
MAKPKLQSDSSNNHLLLRRLGALETERRILKMEIDSAETAIKAAGHSVSELFRELARMQTTDQDLENSNLRRQAALLRQLQLTTENERLVAALSGTAGTDDAQWKTKKASHEAELEASRFWCSLWQCARVSCGCTRVLSTARVDRRWSQVDRRWLGEISITARELLGDASRRIDVSGARLDSRCVIVTGQ